MMEKKNDPKNRNGKNEKKNGCVKNGFQKKQ